MDSYEQVQVVVGLICELGEECSSTPFDGGFSSHAPRRRQILAAPRPTAAPPPVPRTNGGFMGPAMAVTRAAAQSILRKENEKEEGQISQNT
jgi:hypothetical protein